MEAKGDGRGRLSATDFNSRSAVRFAFGPTGQPGDLALAIGALRSKVYSAGLLGSSVTSRAMNRISRLAHNSWSRCRYPRIAALARSAAAVMTTFAGLVPEITSLTPIMKASRMVLDSGWNRIALARSTSASCRLVSAASAASAPNAFLKPSLDQADTRVVASPAAAIRSEVGLLVAHCRNRKAAFLFFDLELMHACQCDMK